MAKFLIQSYIFKGNYINGKNAEKWDLSFFMGIWNDKSYGNFLIKLKLKLIVIHFFPSLELKIGEIKAQALKNIWEENFCCNFIQSS